MKKFLITLTVFVLPIVAALGMTEYKLRNIPNDYTTKNEYLTKHSDSIEVLYLGNSHIYFGLDPAFSKYRSYNAAYTSQSVDLDWKILDKFKGHWKDLKFIILPADYITMYQNLDGTLEEWRLKNYNLYYHFNIGIKPVKHFEILNNKFKDNISRIESFYLQGLQPKKSSSTLGFGISYKYPKHEDIAKTSLKAIQRHTIDINSFESAKNFKNNIQTLQNFVDFAEKRNISIIFVSTPVSTAYFKGIDNVQLKNSIEVYQNLTVKYPDICVYYDLMQDKNFGLKDLYDGDHLNNLGAQKLTALLDKKLLELKTEK